MTEVLPARIDWEYQSFRTALWTQVPASAPMARRLLPWTPTDKRSSQRLGADSFGHLTTRGKRNPKERAAACEAAFLRCEGVLPGGLPKVHAFAQRALRSEMGSAFTVSRTTIGEVANAGGVAGAVAGGSAGATAGEVIKRIEKP